MFRGYDLVAFPAYPESIPTFTAIAASTDLAERKKYQAICAAVKANVGAITSIDTIKILQSQFAPQSEEYKALEDRKNAIECADTINIDKQKIQAMTDLYLNAESRVKILEAEIQKLKMEKNAITAACKRKVSALQRISDEQLGDTLESLDTVTASRDSLRRSMKKLNEGLKAEKKSNLIYKQKITASTQEIKQKDSTIADLKSKLRETVTASKDVKSSVSNLDNENKRLYSELMACQNLLTTYQQAYADIYANVLGVHLDNINVTSSTTVEDLESTIDSAVNTANVPARADMLENYVEESEETVDEDGVILL
jgi:chromosome segregation ATPase